MFGNALGLFRQESAAPVCRIELVLLIHNETGLLLTHAARRGKRFADLEQISGMLAAIQQFVPTVFLERGHNLQEFRVADRVVYFEVGARAMLGGVARGVAMAADSARQFRATLAQFHLEFDQELNDFSGDVAPFDRAAALLRPYVQDADKAWWTRAWFTKRSA